MKIQKMISKKTVITFMMGASLLIITACEGSQGNSNIMQRQSQESETESKPPDMDIHTATFMGNLKVLQQHIQAGTNLDTKDAYGSTPLIIATTFGKTEVARMLIGAGADVNITNNDGSTALHTAAFLCRKEIVKILLENGADKNLKNNFGSTALESVAGPFDSVKGIYDQFSKDLGPLGLKLDYEQLKETRPEIAEMLR
jgi:hypothetical protein